MMQLCEKGRNPNYFELFQLASLIHSSFVPLPDKMDTKTWIAFLRRMVDAKNEYEFQGINKKNPIFFTLVLNMFSPIFLGLYYGDDKVPTLWWFICVLTLVTICFILGIIEASLINEYRYTQEQVVKEMQLAFKCSGYSAEILFAKCCGFESRYVRFTPITERETERLKVLVKEFNDLYNVQKDEAKNKRYDLALWKPLEGQWEQENHFCFGKITKRWLFNGIESKDTFHCQHESGICAIQCVYNLEGNLLLPDSNPSLYSEIFRLDGNFKKNVAFYRFGRYQIWKVEGSTCMQYKFEGNILPVNRMSNSTFWSSLDPINVYHNVVKENADNEIDIETNPLVYAQVV
jgi:hypothetical protein